MRLVATHTCVFQKSGKNKRNNKSLRPCTTNHPTCKVVGCALCSEMSLLLGCLVVPVLWGTMTWACNLDFVDFRTGLFIRKNFPSLKRRSLLEAFKHLKTRFFLKKESPYALTNPVQLTWNKLDTVKHICQSSKNSGMNSFANDGHCTSSNEGNCSLVTQFTPSPWFHVQPIETHLWLESDYKTFPHSRLSINRVPIVLEEKSLTCI